jgi:bifunctional ADP-heptose synthase (sugar kinase/adenylyltransferase)
LEAVAEVGARVEYLDRLPFDFSVSVTDYFRSFSPEVEEWLKVFRERYSVDDVIRHLENLAQLKVLVVGEAIIDEYTFCDGLGKSSKDPILSFLYRWTESQAGGSLAVANHLAGFCRQVGLITFLGEFERREGFVRRALRPNVQPHFLTRYGAPTIHKRRFVDTHTNAKMFELYVMDDKPLDRKGEKALLKTLVDVNEYDLVVAMDYGHGMITPATIELLCRRSSFLTVNTQANAGNRGFNTISKYPRADYVCLAGHEVALETRMQYSQWRDRVLEVIKRIDCPRFTVTQGKDGMLHYDRDDGFVEVPAFATHVTDRVGAGDAVLAVTSLLVKQKTPWDIVGFLGNLAGAQAVADLGNRVAVSKETIIRHIDWLIQELKVD